MSIREVIRLAIGKFRWLRIRSCYPKVHIDPIGFYCGKGCFVSRKNQLTIGRNFYMGNYCHLAANAVIGNDVIFASYVSLVGGDHRIDSIDCPIRYAGRDELRTIYIADNVWIGHSAIILHGVTIQSGAVVAAGSVVTADVRENEVVGGNPAKFIRHRKFS